MGVRFYVSTANAPFFVDNVMGYGDSIPVTGTYKVGDFIISSTQTDGVFGWVCTQAGTPGTWEIIGSGKSGGDEDTPMTISGISNVVEFDDVRNTIAIGINEYDIDHDFLEVHYNGLLLAEGVHYRVESSNKSIVKLEGNWNPGNYPDQQMIFKVIKVTQGNGKIEQIRKVVDINEPTTEVITGISDFVQGSDLLEVHLNGVLLMEGIDFRYSSGKIIKLDISNPWNPHSVQGQKMFIRIIKNRGNMIPGGSGEIPDASIGAEKLTPDLIIKINDKKDPRVGELNNLQTTIKTDVVAAINELKSKADEAFQSGNNAKQGLVDALVAKGIDASTSESWDSLNNKVRNLAHIEGYENLPPWHTYIKPVLKNMWLEAEMAPYSIQLAGSCIWNNQAFIMGGYNSSALNKNYSYDPTTNVWTTRKEVPANISSPCLITYHDKLYFIGGRNTSSSYVKTMYEYDPILNTWTSKNSYTPIGVTSIVAEVANDRIYLFTSSYGVKIYDHLLDTWEDVISDTAHWDRACSYNNLIFLIIDQTLKVFDPIKKTIELKLKTKNPSMGSPVIIGDKIHMLSNKGHSIYHPESNTLDENCLVTFPSDVISTPACTCYLNDHIFAIAGSAPSGQTRANYYYMF